MIRFRGNIHVTAADGEKRAAADWVGRGGRARKLRDAQVTAAGHRVGAVVCVHAKGMKEPWCLAASNAELTAREVANSYAKRWTIEPHFRDTKAASAWGRPESHPLGSSVATPLPNRTSVKGAFWHV